jgi:hypothetical protein
MAAEGRSGRTVQGENGSQGAQAGDAGGLVECGGKGRASVKATKAGVKAVDVSWE